ncbi:Hypothetical protein PHPALM_16537, partial [Phytophthora palmivora]
MRALVKGAVNDVRTRILLDTGANVSVISANYAKRLRLREVPDHGRSLEVRGINPGVLETRRRALVKITLGWERVYEFEMWIMNHSAGVDVVLGTDFMIPAGVRLDLFHGTARLPDEVMVPLIKSLSAADDEPYGTQVVGGPTEDLYIPVMSGESFGLSANDPLETLTKFGSDGRRDSSRRRDETLFERERELYECWLAEQPPAVERRAYPTPRNILTRDAEDPGPGGRRDGSLTFRAVVDASDGVAVEGIPTKELEHTITVSESGDRVFEQAQKQSSTHATGDALYTEASNVVTSANIGASGQ